MKICLTVIALTITTSLFAQTQKVTTKNEELDIKETYEVLKSNPQIRSGKYTVKLLSQNVLVG